MPPGWFQPDFVYARENGRVAENGPLACAPSGHVARFLRVSAE